MRIVTAKSRITFGLACMLSSVLCAAIMLGLVPDRRAAILAGRAAICETLAVSSSDYVSRGEMRRLEFLLESVVKRSEDILSAGVRLNDGRLIAEVGDHAAKWQPTSKDRSTADQVFVPIRSGNEKWGSTELRFQPIRIAGWQGWLATPWIRLAVFVTAASYLLFFFYLGRMLEHLDPSKTVPRRVRAALDSLAEGLLVLDRSGRIVLANQALGSWVARDPEKLIGRNAATLPWVRDEFGAPLEVHPWVEAIRLETPQAGAMLGLKQGDRGIRVLMANASPVLGHDGKYRGVLVSFDDVTQLEETRKDLSAAKQMAEDANRAKSEFLARMSHDIRTPMNAILGYTDVLRRGLDESVENRQEYLDTIHGSGEHLLALINDILDLSKVESGQMELELERCSPHKLISQVAALLQSKADEKGISLEVRFDGPLPETILADSVRLRQAVVNLAGNAIKFTETGGVTIGAYLLQQNSPTADPSDAGHTTQLAIDVVDTGIGIPQAAQDKIFQPFAQADTSVTRRFGGTGLGLAISKQLAEAMGGGIAVASKEGHGSTFTVTVDPGPLEGIAMVEGDAALTAASSGAAETKQITQLPHARILVADDGVSNRKLIELILRRAGVEIVSVENGKLAVDQALQSPFDVILMDMQMPVMDGYTAATTLRQAGYELPIIALTAHAMRGDEEKCRAAGCSGFLTKPIRIDLLMETLSELLEENGCLAADEQQTERADLAAPVDASEQCPVSEAELPLAPPDPPQPAEQSGDALSKSEIERSPAMAEPNSTSATGDTALIRCSYPLDDPDFLEIAQDFSSRLETKLAAMRAACTTDDDQELAGLAHWLKGSGGTAGFHAFTEPAYELEKAAKAQQRERYASLIGKLADIAARLEVSPHGKCAAGADDLGESDLSADGDAATHGQVAGLPGESPLLSSLPTDDADFLEIVEEFAARLADKLEGMERAWQERRYDELAALAHWLKGSGGTAGFDAFTTPAKRLEQLAKQGEADETYGVIGELRRLAQRITVPAPV